MKVVLKFLILTAKFCSITMGVNYFLYIPLTYEEGFGDSHSGKIYVFGIINVNNYNLLINKEHLTMVPFYITKTINFNITGSRRVV